MNSAEDHIVLVGTRACPGCQQLLKEQMQCLREGEMREHQNSRGDFGKSVQLFSLCDVLSCGSSRDGVGSMFHPHQVEACFLLKLMRVVHCRKMLYP